MVLDGTTHMSGACWGVTRSLGTAGTDYGTCTWCLQHGLRVVGLLMLWLRAPRENVPRLQEEEAYSHLLCATLVTK